MRVESAIGTFSITASNSPDNVILSSEKHSTLSSILDSVELIGGAFGEDHSFSLSDIESFSLFGKQHFRTTLSRTQLSRFFDNEILNFLEYPSLAKMRST